MKRIIGLILISSFAFPSAYSSDLDCEATFARSLIFDGSPRKIPKVTADTIISKWNLPDRSLAADIVRLVHSKQLVNQYNSSLGKKGLLLMGGGLCNSTCIATILLAQTGRRDHVEQIEEVVKGLSRIRGTDARIGSNMLFNGYDYLRELSRDGVLTDTLYLKKIYTFREQTLDLEPGDIYSAKVEMEKGVHQILLLGINKERETMLVLDPNWPDRLDEVSYRDGGFENYVQRGFYLRHYGEISDCVWLHRGPIKSLSEDMIQRLSK